MNTTWKLKHVAAAAVTFRSVVNRILIAEFVRVADFIMNIHCWRLSIPLILVARLTPCAEYWTHLLLVVCCECTDPDVEAVVCR